MTYDEVRSGLSLPGSADVWKAGWNSSEDYRPIGNSTVPDERFLSDVCRNIGLSDEIHRVLADALPMFQRNPALARLFRHCHYLFFEREIERMDVVKWPMLPLSTDPGAELFYAFVYLCGTPKVLERNRARGIPDDVTYTTLRDLELWIRWFHDTEGRWGYANLGWLWFHFNSRIFSLGRLQFCLDRFSFDFHGFKNTRTGELFLLAPAGAKVRTDGQFDGTTGVSDPAAFKTTYRETHGTVTGHPVTRDGRILSEQVTLQKEELEQVVAQGDAALSVHMPASGPLAPDTCAESYRRAMEFFPRHFPEFRFNIMFSATWLFDGQLAQLLPADSNIVRFQREYHLFPVQGATDGQTWERVFGHRYNDLTQAPRDTALRRAIVDHVVRGGHMRIGGGLRLART